MRDVMRILDAAGNRAREGLRVMEDVARFVLDDASLCARLKDVRHELREAMALIPGGASGLQAHRDTAGDVGTGVSTSAEMSRTGLRDVALAASRRVTESLRSMEEWSKVVEGSDPSLSPWVRSGEGSSSTPSFEPRSSELRSPRKPLPHGRGSDQESPHPSSRAFEALRYRVYDIERDLVLALGAGRASFKGWSLCVLVTDSLCVHHDWRTVARQALEGGADCLQLREKDMDARELLTRARSLVELARGFDADVIVNDRADVALLAGAAGVHVGQGDLSIADVRRMVGDDLLVGVSASTMEQALQARRDGADSCGVGAMFETSTKRKNEIAGPGLLRDYLKTTPPLAPALAIGGINERNVHELVAAADGAPFGVAVSSCVCAAKKPATVCRAILETLQTRPEAARHA